MGFGRERAQHDVELDDVTIASRALAVLAYSRQDYVSSARIRRRQDQLDRARHLRATTAPPRPKSWPPAQLAWVKLDGNLQNRDVDVRYVGGAGARTLQIAAAPLPGEENTANNSLTRAVNVGFRNRAASYT